MRFPAAARRYIRDSTRAGCAAEAARCDMARGGRLPATLPLDLRSRPSRPANFVMLHAHLADVITKSVNGYPNSWIDDLVPCLSAPNSDTWPESAADFRMGC